MQYVQQVVARVVGLLWPRRPSRETSAEASSGDLLHYIELAAAVMLCCCQLCTGTYLYGMRTLVELDPYISHISCLFRLYICGVVMGAR